MADDDIVVLGESIERHSRTLQNGTVKQRFNVVIKSEKLVHNLDAKTLGKEPAAAIVAVLRERITGITQAASTATLKARNVARRALERGAGWAEKRYAGGRMGAMAPSGSLALFNDSGRFAKSLTANASSDAWRVNVAANRLSPDTLDGRGSLGGENALARIWEQLKSLVPELGDPSLLMDDLRVRGAIDKSLETMITKAKSEGADLAIELVRTVIDGIRAIDELIA